MGARTMEVSTRKNGENWTMDYTAFFWRSSGPYKVKWDVESAMGVLLARDEGGASRLGYSGSNRPPTLGHDVGLRFEAALPDGNWYRLSIVSWVPKTWYTEAEFRAYAERGFQHWTQVLKASPEPGPLESASRALYDSRVREAVEEERLANQPEDMAPVRVIQQDVLAALRNGRSFRTAHHEGGTDLGFNGKNFFRSTYGVEESLVEFSSDDEMIDCLRQFYDWDSRKGTYPHRPPELEVWEFIRGQLRQG